MSSRLLCLLLILFAGHSAYGAEPPSDSKAAQAAAPPSDVEVAAGADAGSSDGQTQGTIVELERGVAYIDLGESNGLHPGMTLQVLRTIVAKHPVSGAELRDHFPLGRMTLEQVSRVLSFGRLTPGIIGTVKVGDVVRLPQKEIPSTAKKNLPNRAGAASGAVGVNSQTDSGDTASAAGTGRNGTVLISSEAVELSSLFDKTLTLPPSARVKLYAAYLEKYPKSPYAARLQSEITFLEQLAATLQRETSASSEAAQRQQQQQDQQNARKRELERLDILAQIPKRLIEGDPNELAITIRDPASVQAVFAYARRPEANSYERIPLVRDGDGYFRALLPPHVVAPPSFELFIESVGAAGGDHITAGTALEPFHVEVEPRIGRPPTGPRGQSEIHGFFEYVDFNRFRGNDYYLVTEGDFTFRPNTWLAGISGGFGVLYGRGGKNDVLQLLSDPSICNGVPDQPPPNLAACGQRVGFNYGYFETEFRIGKWFGLAPRLMVGQTVTGPGVGGELKLRIGQVMGTNLQLAAYYFKDFGALGSLHLEWNVIKGVPMGASVIVTNQPAQGDVGVRILYQIAFRARPWLQPALRVGVAARNIEQIGLSLGLGLITAW